MVAVRQVCRSGKYGAAIDAAIPVLRSFESSQSQNSAGNPYRKNEDIQNNAIMYAL